jgi:putative FmdB family regulatory protein
VFRPAEVDPMPVYEYQCTQCGHRFEVVHAVGETIDRCEQCGAQVRRVFSPVGIIFKGSGFHVTDYRKTPPPAEGDGKAPAATKAGETATKAAKDGAGSSTAGGSDATAKPK